MAYYVPKARQPHILQNMWLFYGLSVHGEKDKHILSACMHVLYLTYLPSYSFIRQPYTSDPLLPTQPHPVTHTRCSTGAVKRSC